MRAIEGRRGGTGITTGYDVNRLNQHTVVAGLALTYSTNGNLIGGPGFALTYDAQNRLVQAAAATGTVTFAYDGRNRVVRRTVTPTGEAETAVWFLWGHAQSGHWGLLEERDSAGNLAARYVHGERIDEILRREGPEGTFYYHQDTLGSTVALTDGTGALVEQYRYDVYGQPSVFDAAGQPLSASAIRNRFLFTGREWLPELGLYDYRNRVYSATLGRFLQPDPAVSDGNLYCYVLNQPDSLLDQYGDEPTINLLHQFDRERQFSAKIPNPPNMVTVQVHYDPKTAKFSNVGSDEPIQAIPAGEIRKWSPKELAAEIAPKLTKYRQTVKLYSCWAAEAAQAVADELQALTGEQAGNQEKRSNMVEVKAPTGKLGWFSLEKRDDPHIYQGTDRTGRLIPGRWVTVKARKKP